MNLIEGFCGDGVVDPGEDCDCGGVAECLKRRSCCTPPGLRYSSCRVRQCLRRRSCCTSMVEFSQESERLHSALNQIVAEYLNRWSGCTPPGPRYAYRTMAEYLKRQSFCISPGLRYYCGGVT